MAFRIKLRDLPKNRGIFTKINLDRNKNGEELYAIVEAKKERYKFDYQAVTRQTLYRESSLAELLIYIRDTELRDKSIPFNISNEKIQEIKEFEIYFEKRIIEFKKVLARQYAGLVIENGNGRSKNKIEFTKYNICLRHGEFNVIWGYFTSLGHTLEQLWKSEFRKLASYTDPKLYNIDSKNIFTYEDWLSCFDTNKRDMLSLLEAIDNTLSNKQ